MDPKLKELGLAAGAWAGAAPAIVLADDPKLKPPMAGAAVVVCGEVFGVALKLKPIPLAVVVCGF